MELGRDDRRAGEGEEAPPAELATTLARTLAAELGAGLRGVVGHGSWEDDGTPGPSTSRS
jgi:hypothetical protein